MIKFYFYIMLLTVAPNKWYSLIVIIIIVIIVIVIIVIVILVIVLLVMLVIVLKIMCLLILVCVWKSVKFPSWGKEVLITVQGNGKNLFKCQMKSGAYLDTPFLMVTVALHQSIIPIAVDQ